MIKKAPNNIIFVRIQIIDSDKYIDLQIPQHTLIKEIENKIANQLRLNPFKVQFSFQHKSSAGILNSSSTLYQNKVKSSDIIYLKMLNIQTRSQAKSVSNKGQLDYGNMTSLDIISTKPSKFDSITKGLNLNIVCKNKRCLNYNKDIILQLGLGTHNYNYLISQLKCPTCPFKELNANPFCQVTDFIFKQCLWILDGKIISHGIEIPYKLQNWIIVNTLDSENLSRILQENQWTNINIVVKEIGRPKQKIPLLL